MLVYDLSFNSKYKKVTVEKNRCRKIINGTLCLTQKSESKNFLSIINTP